MNERILTVFLVDDERIIREGMKKLFRWEENGFCICGEAANGRDALEAILRLQPDIVITDLRMPLMDGLTLCTSIARQCPAIESVIVTGYDEFAYARDAVKAGVFDFLLKPVSPVELQSTMLRLRKKILTRSVGYPFADERALTEAVFEQRQADALAILDRIFDELARAHATVEDVRNIANKLLTEVDATCHRNAGAYEPIERPALPETATVSELRTLVTNYLTHIFRAENSEATDRLVEKIKRYLEENYRQNISLKLLETEFFFNASYISRIFKAKVGKNYSDYLLEVRIQHAKELLAETNRPIGQISETVGFGNSKYFSRVFKAVTGMQPITYRNQVRGEAHE